MTKVKAKVKWTRIAPRKLDRVVKLIRRMPAKKALELLRFMPQKGARILEKTIKSAIANAKNNYKLAEDNLIISEAYVNKGSDMKRIQPRARGRAFSILKRNSHLTIWVMPKEELNPAPKVTEAK
jgi:large subunit ribosomal protein L22